MILAAQPAAHHPSSPNSRVIYYRSQFHQLAFRLGAFPVLRPLDEFPGGFKRAFRVARPADHDRQFLETRLPFQRLDGADGAVAGGLLADAVLGIGEGSNLRQMRDTDYLVVLGEFPELPADDLAAAPADADIYLVENKHRNRVRFRQGTFHRQQKARYLTGRGDFSRRLW